MSTAAGRAAEAAAAEFLLAKGCRVVAQNWRTRWCEVDLIVERANTIYFVEVKYRGAVTWGEGFDYITPQKLRQMQFAAEFWCARHKFAGDYRLAAVALSGNPPRVVGAVNSIE